MEYDLATHLTPVQALAPAAYAAATDGEIIDSIEFNSLTFAVPIIRSRYSLWNLKFRGYISMIVLMI